MKVNNLTTTYVTPVEIDPFYFKTNRYASLEFHTPDVTDSTIIIRKSIEISL